MGKFTDDEAKDIHKSRWGGETIQSIVARYQVNTFRVYEVLQEDKNLGTRLQAFEELKLENPKLASSTDPTPHIPKRKVVMRSALIRDAAITQHDLFS